MINIISSIFSKIFYMSIIGSIISVIVIILIKLFDKKLSARYKFFMWMIPLIFFIVPFSKIPINIDINFEIFSVPNKLEQTLVNNYKENKDIPNIQNLKNNEPVNLETPEEPVFFNHIIPIIWGFTTISITIMFFIGFFNLHKTINNNVKCNDTNINNILIKCKRELNIKRKIYLTTNFLNQSPCIYGLLKPQIILPYNLVNEEDLTIENVFRHELSHYKRKDIITNYLLLFMTIIHWFNPFVYLFFKKIRQQIELATDELALKYMNKQERKMYGLTLINLLQTYENEKNMSKILCITDDEKHIEKRIIMIKNSNKKSHKKIIGALTLIFMFFVTLPFIIEASNISTNTNIQENIKSTLSNQFIENTETTYNEALENHFNSNIYKTNEASIKNNELFKKENANYMSNPLPEQSVNSAHIDVNLFGTYRPYKAFYNKEEVSLQHIYGTGFSTYGGELVLKDDGTYTEFIGISSIDNINGLQGTYEIFDTNIIQLTNHNNETKYIICTLDSSSNIVLIEYNTDGTIIYLKKITK